MTTPEPGKPFVVKDTVIRDAAIAIGAGLLVLIFVLYGIGAMSRTVGGDWLSGKIVEKEFRPAPASEISFGSKGLRKREVAGEYLFKVKVKDVDEPFLVWVDRTTYETHRTGQRFKFPRPKPVDE